MHKRGAPSILGKKLGPYHVKGELGHGGMGAVYLAVDTALDRKVALKTLLPRHAGDAEFAARFQREARASARLNHPNIVQIYTVDIESDPAYMAMEYVDGESLESRIRREGPMKWQHALTVVSQVAAALACAHAAGIIHRDIKPANILIDKTGRARVTDFGIAKILDSQTNLTGTEHTVGSPCYMSPEQCGKGEVGPASDLFSLGVMLYELLAGKVPFIAESSLAVMKRITEEDLPRLEGLVEGLPPQAQRLLDTLAARDPAFRYATADQVLEDLRAFHAGAELPHVQALDWKRAQLQPATASAANPARSPSGPSPALRTSLVDELLDAPLPRPVPVRTGTSAEVPWAGILVTSMVIIFAALGMLYYKGWRQSRPPDTVQNQRESAPVDIIPTGPRPPQPGEPGFGPAGGFRPDRRPGSGPDGLPPRVGPGADGRFLPGQPLPGRLPPHPNP